MQLTSRHELAFVTATLTYRGTTVEVPDVLVDTGAASTVLNADLAADAGIYLAPNDLLRRLRGVGEVSDAMNDLLRANVGRKGKDATSDNQDISPPHSITSSAKAST